MKIESKVKIVVLDPNIGQGKSTIKSAILDQLEKPSDGNPNGLDVQTITPDDGNMQTQMAWQVMRAGYQSLPMQRLAQGQRGKGAQNGLNNWLLTLANREISTVLSGTALPVLTMQGYMGLGLPRYFAEGDIHPDSAAIDEQTVYLLPHEDTRRQVEEHGKKYGFVPRSELTGFIIPQELLSEDGKQRTIDVYKTGSPDSDNPLRIAFLMTGQLAHTQDLHSRVFGDEIVQQMVRDGRVIIDVYTWNNKKAAKRAEHVAQGFGLDAVTITEYDPAIQQDPSKRHGVQVFWNEDRQTAIGGKIAMAGMSHLLVHPPAEGAFWVTTKPTVFLDPVWANPKMEGNLNWLRHQNEILLGPASGIAGLGETIETLYADGGSAVERHFEHAATLFDGKLNGAANIANILISASNGHS
jgi:hypothetical protein